MDKEISIGENIRGEYFPHAEVATRSTPPSDYVKGYAKARSVDPETADNYIRHTWIGDPELDPVMEELAKLPRAEANKYISAGIEGKTDVLRNAPSSLREFFKGIEDPPDWVDYASFKPGIRAFHTNGIQILAAFVAGVLIEGFATMIGKSFFLTGRVIDKGARRLRQNNRHQVEIFHPDGLHRESDGWKLSVRIRFVHAQVRLLLATSGEWDEDSWGVPISAANLGYSIACFSARTLVYSTALGARYSPEQREGFCAVWRYVGNLMGIPEAILYKTEEEALQMYRIATLCEPEPDIESIVMTNALISSAPLVAGITDPVKRRNLANDIIYPITRALVGNELADQLRFPACTMWNAKKILFLYQLDTRLKRNFPRLFKGENTMQQLFEASWYDPDGIKYDLPDNVEADQSSDW